MKTTHAIPALLFSALFVSAASFAGEEIEIKKRIQIKLGEDSEMIAVDADDMGIGETRQSFTESGKEVLLTRTQEGFDLAVDGEQIDLGLGHGEHHSVFMHGGEGARKIIIRKMGGEGEGHGYHVIHAGEGEGHHGEHHWVSHGEHGDGHSMTIEHVRPSEHLLESGVLDGLDEETRQRILDTLKEIEPRVHVKKHRVNKVREEG